MSESTETAFIDNDFLLNSATARRLFHDVAEHLPIIDFHSHLDPGETAGNTTWKNLTRIWLAHDHYKWRAMRWHGIDETYITGNAPDRDKFLAWARTVPWTVGNPLYHWTHLELAYWFDINGKLLDETNGEQVFRETELALADPAFTAWSLLDRSRVELLATTDDPLSTLDHHATVAKSGRKFQMMPTFRPDPVNATGDPAAWNRYIDDLSQCTGMAIESFEGLLQAISSRIDFFHQHGCRLADHGLTRLYNTQSNRDSAEKIFKSLRAGNAITIKDHAEWQMTIMTELALFYHARKWVMQIHYGALRNNNRYLWKLAGPDSGGDSIGDRGEIESLGSFLDSLTQRQALPRMIIYPIHPGHYAPVLTMIGCFQQQHTAGWLQLGAAWWHMDNLQGIVEHIDTTATLGLLPHFIGMVTDSRSILSLTRHDYFRRILCRTLGSQVDSGVLPGDRQLLQTVIESICYQNAADQFLQKDNT
jgi:glucuronate isomerase